MINQPNQFKHRLVARPWTDLEDCPECLRDAVLAARGIVDQLIGRNRRFPREELLLRQVLRSRLKALFSEIECVADVIERATAGGSDDVRSMNVEL